MGCRFSRAAAVADTTATPNADEAQVFSGQRDATALPTAICRAAGRRGCAVLTPTARLGRTPNADALAHAGFTTRAICTSDAANTASPTDVSPPNAVAGANGAPIKATHLQPSRRPAKTPAPHPSGFKRGKVCRADAPIYEATL